MLFREQGVGPRAAPHARGLLPVAIIGVVLTTASARAEVAEPSGRADEAFDFMNLLSQHHLHDLNDEDWNAYGALTDIWTQKFGFHARYTNLDGSTNSLITRPELSFSETATIYLALRLWSGGEAYFVPEIIGERTLSDLHGLGGAIQNFELQKSGSTIPTPYLSRTYLRQTFALGGAPLDKTSDPSQLARTDRSQRLVFTVGNFSVIDFFDKNTVSGDLTRSYFNMAFLTYAAYDFAADARGYAWGGTAELDYDDWTVRFGRFTPPKDPNQLPLDFRLDKVYGDQAEVEHDHRFLGQTGAFRVLGYRNVENMGRFADAIAAFKADPTKNAATCKGFSNGSTNATAPDVCWARQPYVGHPNVKVGIGFSFEQQVRPDVGVFFRGMVSDGQTEAYSYTSTDRSLSVGGTARGTGWKRAADMIGVGWSAGWISSIHAEYLGLGGIDGFIGDGKIHQASEQVLEAFYSLSLGSSAWLSADYQHIWNPAYNADRGPVNILGGRAHVEF
jgi:high affinity Mn2+ porin